MYPYPTSCRSILILFFYLSLGLPSASLLPVSPPNPVYASTLPICATCPAYLILLDLITRTILGEQYRSLSSSLYTRCLLYSPVTSYLLGPNILLSSLFSNTIILRSSLSVSDYVSHPYKMIGKTLWRLKLIDWFVIWNPSLTVFRSAETIAFSFLGTHTGGDDLHFSHPTWISTLVN
jgi:hypothetical protein